VKPTSAILKPNPREFWPPRWPFTWVADLGFNRTVLRLSEHTRLSVARCNYNSISSQQVRYALYPRGVLANS
jgi:hypothetical protein